MDTKKTIFVSIVTTLATMFVVMVCMHILRSNCGQQLRCGNNYHCSSSYSHGGGHSRCTSYSKSCDKGGSKCEKGDSKCSKGKKCCKSKSSCKKGDVKTCTKSTKDGKTIIKKVVEIEE